MKKIKLLELKCHQGIKMVCPGFFLKKLLDFTYIRSKDDEKVISIRNVNDEYDFDGIDRGDIGQDPEGD